VSNGRGSARGEERWRARAAERRRAGSFLATAGKGLLASSAASAFPAIVPASVLGADAPSNRVNVGAIGVGRISRGHDLPGVWRHGLAQVVAVCDLTAAPGRREGAGERALRREDGRPYDGVTGHSDYRDCWPTRTWTPW